jgi:putative glutamine amidotransferase
VGITGPERVPEEYCWALARHGARVLALSAQPPGPPLEELDGLLLSGGGDVDPVHYGRPRHPRCGEPEAARDEFELRLTRQAVAAGIPVLGICRGAQVLGVALGGTLIQDIPCQRPGALEHNNARHWVRVAEGSRLREILACDRLEVNSFHHQANDCLGEGLQPSAWSEDSVIEAIERDGEGFAMGVQWHPERMSGDPCQERLFAAFLGASQEHGRSRRKGRE